jgi:AcrR family transcriptional regulator
MSSEKPRNASDVNNRTRLLQAATDAFAEHGFEGASLRAIADSAGVSFQLIAYYFGSKEELWVATVDYLFERYFETGKGLGFQTSSNIFEQFHNHLRLLLTDMQQRPQLRKIWIQEYFADSERYRNVIKPQIEQLHHRLALPYYQEVVRLGIVRSFSAVELGLLFASIVQNNVVYPYYIELLLELPAGSAKSIEAQVDLIFNVLTAEPPASLGTDSTQTPEASKPSAPAMSRAAGAPAPAAPASVVYAWKETRETGERSEPTRAKQLEIENLHLKQLVGSLLLEKKVLLEKLQEREDPNQS